METKTTKEPKRILLPAWLILRGMGLLSFLRPSRGMIRDHLLQNSLVWEEFAGRLRAASKDPGQKLFLERQDLMGNFLYGRERKFLAKKLLGQRPLCAKENACEVIAVYNALLALFQEADFPQLLSGFEAKGISLFGYFGTSFMSLKRFFAKRDVKMQVLTGKKITKEALESGRKQGFSVCILMAENKAGFIGEMVHTICITKEGEIWQAHNDYEGSKNYDSLEEAVFGYHNGVSRPLGVILLQKT
ncbi:MAG: hypothetical protein K5739_06295 [Lachnospiraceae bacterium]|nr:hypothetical protein [Lachnospiraceae bacterium]